MILFEILFGCLCQKVDQLTSSSRENMEYQSGWIGLEMRAIVFAISVCARTGRANLGATRYPYCVLLVVRCGIRTEATLSFVGSFLP